jgi:hypothetical protein
MRPEYLVVCATIMAVGIACWPGLHAARAEPAIAKIVGLGATPCPQFERETREQPEAQKQYLAWAQGFMSGILMSRPPGVDEGLDLNPRSFGLLSLALAIFERAHRLCGTRNIGSFSTIS